MYLQMEQQLVWDGDVAGTDVAYHNEVSGFAQDDTQALLDDNW